MKKAKVNHRDPSAASLREMPEIDWSKATVRRNPYAERIAREGIQIVVGRPRKGTNRGPSEPRSVRFPVPVWKRLEQLAKNQGTTLHAVLRAAVVDWIEQQR